MAQRIPIPKEQFFDDNGEPLAGGKLYSYLAGTSSPATTYTDESGATPNTNPIILDGAGRCSLWISNSTSYKFVLKDANDVDQWTVDDVSAPSSSGGGSDPGAWVEHEITDGQAATDIEGETLDLSVYSSAVYDVEIIRGTTVFSNMPSGIAIQNVNGVGRRIIGQSLANEAHGVAFTITQVGTVVQLRAAASSGPGNGTVKLSRRVVPASP